MRLGLGLGFVFVCSLGSLSCKSETTPPVYLDANYQVRCLDCQPRTSDDPEREVMYLDGEFDWDISCRVDRINGRDSMTLVADYEGERSDRNYGFRITRANIGTSEQSSECEVRITEGANTYEGACSGEDPAEDRPCRVDLERDGEVVEGTVYCERITNTVNRTAFRYLVRPGSDDRAARFEVHNCAGL